MKVQRRTWVSNCQSDVMKYWFEQLKWSLPGITRMIFAAPGVPNGNPAVTTRRSVSSDTRPFFLPISQATQSISRKLSTFIWSSGQCSGYTPHDIARWRQVAFKGEIAKMGWSGRFMDAMRAVLPPTVKLAMHLAFTFLAICLAARMIALVDVPSVIFGLVLWRYAE